MFSDILHKSIVIFPLQSDCCWNQQTQMGPQWHSEPAGQHCFRHCSSSRPSHRDTWDTHTHTCESTLAEQRALTGQGTNSSAPC